MWQHLLASKPRLWEVKTLRKHRHQAELSRTKAVTHRGLQRAVI